MPTGTFTPQPRRRATSPTAYVPPPDYTAMFSQYWAEMVRYVARRGIPVHDAEDIAKDIWVRLEERDIIGMYEPGLVVNESKGPATFKTFFYRHLEVYTRGKVQRWHRDHNRELCVLNAPAFDDVLVSEVIGTVEADVAEAVNAEVDYLGTLGKIREGIAASVAAQTKPLLAFFDALVHSIDTTGGYSKTALAKEFGVKTSVITVWLEVVQEIAARVC